MRDRRLFTATALMLALAVAPKMRAQWMLVDGPSSEHFRTLGVSGSNLFVACDSGLYRSTDQGISWVPANSGLGGAAVDAFASDGTNIFAGTDSGVFLSANNGTSWAPVNTLSDTNGLASYTIRVLVVSGNYLFAGTNSGLFRSSDNGTTWTTIENGLTEGNIYALVAIGSDLFVGNLGGGVFHSTDNGDSWTPANTGLTSSYIHVLTEIGSDPSSAILFAGTIDKGVFLSTNNGVSWNPASTGLPANTYVQDLLVNGTNLFVSTFDSAVYRSTDNGTNWQHVSSGITDTNVYTLAVCDTTLFAGTIHGVWRRSLSDFNNSSVTHVTSAESSLSNYPNPFNQSTTINFTTPESGVATVTTVNALGTEIARIFSGELSAGEHTFAWDATGLPPGMYECIVQMNGSVQREASIKN